VYSTFSRGFPLTSTRSAVFPTCIVPKASDAFRNSAASRVAAARAPLSISYWKRFRCRNPPWDGTDCQPDSVARLIGMVDYQSGTLRIATRLCQFQRCLSVFAGRIYISARFSFSMLGDPNSPKSAITNLLHAQRITVPFISLGIVQAQWVGCQANEV
jgi:hypothetical protein